MFCISQYVTQCCTTIGSPIVIVTLSAHYTIHILITYYCFILLYIIYLYNIVFTTFAAIPFPSGFASQTDAIEVKPLNWTSSVAMPPC